MEVYNDTAVHFIDNNEMMMMMVVVDDDDMGVFFFFFCNSNRINIEDDKNRIRQRVKLKCEQEIFLGFLSFFVVHISIFVSHNAHSECSISHVVYCICCIAICLVQYNKMLNTILYGLCQCIENFRIKHSSNVS